MLIAKLLRFAHNQFLIKKSPIRYARKIGVRVGENCRLLGVSTSTFGSEPYFIAIGNHVTVTAGVRFITHDGGVWVFRDELQDIDVFGPIVIGSNVFIGLNTIILPGAVVEDNVVIGAGSVVRGRLAAGSVYAGVPAKRIKSIDEYREKMVCSADYTKGMKKDEKRMYLTSKYLDGGHE